LPSASPSLLSLSLNLCFDARRPDPARIHGLTKESIRLKIPGNPAHTGCPVVPCPALLRIRSGDTINLLLGLHKILGFHCNVSISRLVTLTRLALQGSSQLLSSRLLLRHLELVRHPVNRIHSVPNSPNIINIALMQLIISGNFFHLNALFLFDK
jgi:hypothetical protein